MVYVHENVDKGMARDSTQGVHVAFNLVFFA